MREERPVGIDVLRISRVGWLGIGLQLMICRIGRDQ